MAEEPKKRKFFRVSEVAGKALDTKNQMLSKGWSTGFNCLDKIISYKRGNSTVVFSYAHQGKTQFVIEECVWLALEHQVVSLVYLTEAGSLGETILDIVQTYLGKNLSTSNVTDDELIEAMNWMDKYFILLNCEDSLLDIREIYSSVKEAEKECGITIGNLVIDHYGNVNKEEGQKFFNIADNVKHILQAVTRTSKKFNLHTFILFHVRDTDPIKDKVTEIYYMPEPEMHAIAGGQQVNYLGQQIISVWRAVSSAKKLGIADPATGVPYLLNETRITVHKSKPKFIGFLGTASIFFNADKQCYYEKDDHWDEFYAGEYNRQYSSEYHKPKAPKHFQDQDIDIFTSVLDQPSSAIKPNNNFERELDF